MPGTHDGGPHRLGACPPSGALCCCFAPALLLGCRAERHVSCLLLAVAQDGDLDRGPGGLFADGGRQLVRVADGQVVELRDDIADLDAGLVGGRARLTVATSAPTENPEEDGLRTWP